MEFARARGYETAVHCTCVPRSESLAEVRQFYGARFDPDTRQPGESDRAKFGSIRDMHDRSYAVWPRMVFDIEHGGKADTVVVSLKDGKEVYRNSPAARDGQTARDLPFAFETLIFERNKITEPLTMGPQATDAEWKSRLSADLRFTTAESRRVLGPSREFDEYVAGFEAGIAGLAPPRSPGDRGPVPGPVTLNSPPADPNALHIYMSPRGGDMDFSSPAGSAPPNAQADANPRRGLDERPPRQGGDRAGNLGL